jgi:hypothetical protein
MPSHMCLILYAYIYIVKIALRELGVGDILYSPCQAFILVMNYNNLKRLT